MHSISITNLLTYSSNRSIPPHKRHTIFSLAPTTSINMKSIGFGRVRKEDLSRPRMSPVTHLENSGSSNLDEHITLEFGNFVAKEAILDEELWAAAYLRTECYSEYLIGERYSENCEAVDLTTLEFNALKERSNGKLGETNKCVVAVMEDGNVKCTLIESVVGTLDFSIRQLLHGESFPGEERKKYWFPFINTNHPEKYVYISNVCVRLSARRQSIASNMLRFVIESAKLSAIASIYVRVHRNNEPAIALYRKIGFQAVKKANSHLFENQMYLLCYRA